MEERFLTTVGKLQTDSGQQTQAHTQHVHRGEIFPVGIHNALRLSQLLQLTSNTLGVTWEEGPQ